MKPKSYDPSLAKEAALLSNVVDWDVGQGSCWSAPQAMARFVPAAATKEYVPALQFVQAEVPVCVENVPEPQYAQVEAPGEQYRYKFRVPSQILPDVFRKTSFYSISWARPCRLTQTFVSSIRPLQEHLPQDRTVFFTI
jgi:hypothetical protein